MRRLGWLAVFCLVWSAPALATPGDDQTSAGAPSSADAHMLAGAQFFRDERYAEALVEFRAAEKTSGGDPGAAWYVASTLVKLKRPEDALVAFTRADTVAPRERDGLFDYYRALACYEARLYLCADRLLAAVGDDPGPRIAAQARQIRRDLGAVVSASPTTAAIDWYHAKGQAALKAERPALAAAYFDEAAALAALRSDRHRRAEALEAAVNAHRAAAPERGRP
jgi:tetratricopeptide (TPR) repeat protein